MANPVNAVKAPSPSTQEREKTGLAIFTYYSTAKTFEYEGAFLTGSQAFSTNVSEEASATFGVGLSFSQSLKRFNERVGWQVGLTHDFTREFDSFTGDIQGDEFSGEYDLPHPSLEVTTLFLNGTFQTSEKVYLLGGPFLPFVDYKDTAGGLNIKGQLSFQLGLGWRVNSNIEIEAIYRMLRAEVEEVDSVNDLTLATENSLDGVNVLLKWLL